MRLLVLIYYLFVSVFLVFVSIYDAVDTLLDPEMTYLKKVPVGDRNHDFLELIYFKTNIVCVIIGFLLIFIGYKYYKQKQSVKWRILYNTGFVLVTIITVLLLYVLSVDEAIS